MCVSMGPIEFSNTIHGIFEVNVGGQVQHVVFYQNTVAKAKAKALPAGSPPQQFIGQPAGATSRRPAWASQPGGAANWQLTEPATGNALIIPLLGDFSTVKLVDLSNNKSALKDIAEALTPRGRGAVSKSMLSFGDLGGMRGEVQVLDYDIYTIVIAECAGDIPRAVQAVPARKRPKAVQSIFDAFEAGYGTPIAVCCFDPEEGGEAAPVAFRYVPYDVDHLFLYTLDGHDGNAPDYNAQVKLDHTLFVGSYLMQGGLHIGYSEPIANELKPYMPTRIVGGVFSSTHQNGDVVFDAAEVRKGVFNGLRALPPGAPAQPGRRREFITLSY